MKILVVCLGNICRSPLGEAVLQQKAAEAGLDWIVESAGTNHYHIGEPPHQLSQKVAALNGLDISNQRARRFEAGDFEKFDKIFAMANDVREDIMAMAGDRADSSKLELFLDKLFPGKQIDVPDPWYGPEPGYHEVYKLIGEAADAIISSYLSRRKL